MPISWSSCRSRYTLVLPEREETRPHRLLATAWLPVKSAASLQYRSLERVGLSQSLPGTKPVAHPRSTIPPITILYDGTIYNSQHRGGISRYSTLLIEHLAALEPAWEFHLHVNSGPTAPLPEAPNVHVLRRRYLRPGKLFFPVNAASRALHARTARPALLHSTLYRPFRFASRCPLVVTIYDMIVHLRPDLYPGRANRRFRGWVEWSARRASAILTISEASRNDIVRILGVPLHKIHLTHPGLDPKFTPPSSSEVA